MSTSDLTMTENAKLNNVGQSNPYACAIPSISKGSHTFKTKITSNNVHNFFGFVEKSWYESHKSDLRWTQQNTIFMYCSRSCIFVDGSEKVKHPSGKQVNCSNNPVIVTTVNFESGEVVYKVENGEEIGRTTFDKLKSGSWYYCVICGGGSPSATLELVP